MISLSLVSLIRHVMTINMSKVELADTTGRVNGLLCAPVNLTTRGALSWKSPVLWFSMFYPLKVYGI
jgi:hypothetical protein